jgi:hypothetical protein
MNVHGQKPLESKPSGVKPPEDNPPQPAVETQLSSIPFAAESSTPSATPIQVPPLKPAHIIQLQRNIGNRATQKLLRAQSHPPPIQRGFISDFFSDVWDFLTGASETESKPKSKRSSATKPVPVSDPTRYTVTDPVAYVRTPPPELHSTGELLSVGREVTIFERATKSGKDYVHVALAMQPGDQGPAQSVGWTWRGNLSGGTHEPTEPEVVDPEEPEIDDPDSPITPPSGDIPGLPPLPAITHVAFTSIVTALERMEQNPVPTGAVREETGDAREQRVSDIRTVRDQIAALSAAELDMSEKEFKDAKAYLYRRLAPLAPYFDQFANANILATGKKAWKRTCNVTVPAMVLEGLGKSLSDYTGDVELLRRILGRSRRSILYETSRFPQIPSPISTR